MDFDAQVDALAGVESELLPVKPVKKRLLFNDERLVSDEGLPQLEKLLDNVTIRGPGHELADLTKVLAVYEAWAQELAPKMSFSEAISRLEKLGAKALVAKYMRGLREGGSNAEFDDMNFDDLNLGPDMSGISDQPHSTPASTPAPTPASEDIMEEDGYPAGFDPFSHGDIYDGDQDEEEAMMLMGDLDY